MTSARASANLGETTGVRPRSWSIAQALLVPATMIVILAVALLLLMMPLWTHFALSASGATNAFASPDVAYQLSDRTVSELLFGPGTFSAFAADEAAHMRDVRVVFYGFLLLAIASVFLIAWQLTRHGRDVAVWRSISRGGLWLVIALIVLGLFAAFAFDTAFELFHRIFFPGGNWAFPADSLLITLYPYAFWELSAAAIGVLGIGAGFVVWWVARRWAESLERGAGS
jgi:integral membrane protein (TIGR01906 family)